MPTRTKPRMRALASLLALSTSGVAFAAAAAPVAPTENGPVTGVVAGDVQEFLGIRYAAPPVGPLRWQPPQPVPQRIATTDATAFGPHCAQAASPYGVASSTEDCLYLNVFVPNTPRPADAPKLPVMVWIHGGALVVGESDAYDPAALVNNGIIVVTINYRLGYFGFLATSGLDAEGHVAANYGLQDQQFAMDWVQRNIAGFGGDPARIAIAGESAGGLSVLSNLVSPTAYGLFDRAIVQSGGYALNLPTLAQAETTGAAVASGLGCASEDTACLRAASTDAILAQEASAGLSVTTIVDGTTIPESIDTALAAGRFNRVPVLNGSNRDEERLFVPAYAGLAAADYPAALASVYGPTFALAVAAEYPVGNYKLPVYALAAALTDQIFACPAQQIDLWTAPYVPTYAYEFNDRRAPEVFLPAIPGYNFGAAHASELQFLFDLGQRPPGVPPLTPREQQLSAAMTTYWANFAAAGSPNSPSLPYWADFKPAEGNMQSLRPPAPKAKTNFAAVHHCTFWRPLIDPS